MGAGGTVDETALPAGTLGHRLYACPVLEPDRARLASGQVLACVNELSQQAGGSPGEGIDSAQWLRGLFPKPVELVPPKPRDDSFHWEVRPEGGLCSEGTVYTDGPLIDAEAVYHGLCGRLGWAFVVLAPDGSVVAAAFGRPPWWVDSIHGAELWALAMATEYCLPFLPFRTDCYAVFQGVWRGQQWATCSARKYARIWVRIFHHLDSDSVDNVV